MAKYAAISIKFCTATSSSMHKRFEALTGTSEDEALAITCICDDWLRIYKTAVEYDAAHKALCKDKSIGGVPLVNAETAALDAIASLVPKE
jgi:hypothetical protein